jgi:putative PIN family toxin of toxin-antitoxin system
VIRVTLDVNVLASGFPAEAGTPSMLIQRWTDLEYELVLSAHILDELERTWQKPYFRRRYSSQRAGDALRLLRTAATIVVPAATVSGVGEDLEDDLVIATAVAGNADFLVTGDKHLQGLGHFRGITILAPHQFLEWLQSER